ncbi:MAG: RodZ domain-containing protein [Luteimonas sp.]
MTSIESQAMLRADGCGARLRAAREAAGLSLEQVGTRLKMPVRVLHSLEAEQWDCLGAPVFVRGQLRSYARLLGVDIAPMIESTGVGRVTATMLVSRVHTPPLQRMLEQTGRRLVYVVMTAVIVVPIWMMATRGPITLPAPQDTTPLDIPSSGAARPPSAAPTERSTVAASMAPMPSRPAAAPALSIHFNGDSWVEVISADGAMLEKGLIAAGTQRSYATGQVAKILLGNASAVVVSRAGQPVDLAPFQRANVVRFAVSSDGSLAPFAD